ncbi:MAG: hypothetical protein ACI4NG_00665, partial [Candidatus Gallimonas sp.]
MSVKSIERLELNKILSKVAEYAVLEETKRAICALSPCRALSEANARLDLTEEATRLLFFLGAGRIEYFSPLGDLLERAQKGATLSCAELTQTAALLRSARVCYRSVQALSDGAIGRMKELTARLVPNEKLEREIGEKIVGENDISDGASDRLYSIRK